MNGKNIQMLIRKLEEISEKAEALKSEVDDILETIDEMLFEDNDVEDEF